MTDLITFLRAQLDADEQLARSADPGPWIATPIGYSKDGDRWTQWWIRLADDADLDATIVASGCRDEGDGLAEANARATSPAGTLPVSWLRLRRSGGSCTSTSTRRRTRR